MKISVVTISFNQREFLDECIDSVASQEGPWEHIICDAGSVDGSRELIHAREKHFSHVIFESDSGPAEGLNKGFALASGEIFYYLNSDDIVLPGAFTEARSYFKKYQSDDVIYGDGFVINKEGVVISNIQSSPFLNAHACLSGAISLVQQATFFRSDAFNLAGGFNIKNRSCWDGELVADMSRAGLKFRHVRRNWGGFRFYSGSISGSCDPKIIERYVLARNRMFFDAYGREKNALDHIAKFMWRSANFFAKKIGF